LCESKAQTGHIEFCNRSQHFLLKEVDSICKSRNAGAKDIRYDNGKHEFALSVRFMAIAAKSPIRNDGFFHKDIRSPTTSMRFAFQLPPSSQRCRAVLLSSKMLITKDLWRVRSREAFGVRGACSRFQ
jgi:hypothetical protein